MSEGYESCSKVLERRFEDARPTGEEGRKARFDRNVIREGASFQSVIRRFQCG